MDLLNIGQLLITNECWKYLIDLFQSFLGNYGWAIILFTIVLKIILSPLDFFQRKVTLKNAEVQALAQPELEVIKNKYTNDKEKYNQAQMAVFKKHNYNVGGSCIVMLLYMAVTLVIFITLFNSLRYIAKIEMVNQYESLKSVYTETLTDKEAAVLQKYEEIKGETKFLWVKNIWKSDTNTSIMMSFDEYYKQSGLSLDETEKEAERVIYENIEDIIYSVPENSGWNGYFVLIFLAGAIAFLSQWITTKLMKPKVPKNSQDPTASTNKVMMIVLPIIMVFFAYSSSSLFALYLITNSIMTTLITFVISWIMKSKKNTETTVISKKSPKVVEYSRNYFKGDKK